MSESINTIDLLGDNVVFRSIVDRTITEFKDDKLITIRDYAFAECRSLTLVDLVRVTSLGERVFDNCTTLTTLILRSETMVALGNSAIPYRITGQKLGYVYVPRALIDVYTATSPWNTFTSQIRVLEDYTVDGTVDGEWVQKYKVRFMNGDTVLQEVLVPYGGSATYTGDTPVNNSTGNTADFTFVGWYPDPTNITEDTDCYAEFEDNREITDTWSVMATKASNGTAVNTYGVGMSKTLDVGAIDLPYDFREGSAVVYNNEIHIMGTYDKSYRQYHYKWDGTEWTSVSTLPYTFYKGSAVVYNNEIHIIGGDGNYNKHYKWNGSEWVSVSTLPYTFYQGSAVVYNDEIHIMGSYNSSCYKSHYKWNGTEWVSVGTLPYDFYRGSAVVYNDEIHIFGGNGDNKSHYKWNGTEWISVGTLPYDFSSGHVVIYNDELYLVGSGSNPTTQITWYKWNGSSWGTKMDLPYSFYSGQAVVYNNEIHIMGTYTSSIYYKAHYKWNGTEWSKNGDIRSIPMQIVAHNQDLLASNIKWNGLGELPYNFYYGSVVMYNDEIHIIGSTSSSCQKYHYKWTGAEWISVSTLPYNFYNGSAIVLNNEIHIMGTYSGGSYRKHHYKWNGSEWVSVSTLPYDFYDGSAVVYNNEIHIMGTSSSTSNYKSHYKWNGTEWVSVSTLPYDFIYGSAVMYDGEIHIMGSYSSSYQKSHYKWNGAEWVSVSTLPYNFCIGSAVVLNDEIHIIGTYANNAYQKYHYKWNGSEWASVSTLPYSFYKGSAVVYNDEIHIMGSEASGHYKDFYCLDTSNPTATLTFVAKVLLIDARTFNSGSALTGGYNASSLRTWLNGEFLATLPTELQTAIVEVKKLSDGGDNRSLVTTAEKVWIPSLEELGISADGVTVSGQGEAYSVFTSPASRIRKTSDKTAQKYFTRSTFDGTKSNAILPTGEVGQLGSNEEAYVLVGFCM